MEMLSEDPEAFRKISSSSSSTSAAENISNATDLERLSAALDPVNGWDYEPEQTLAMRCARAHVGEGSYRLDQVRSLPCALHHKAHQEHPLGTWQHLLATLFVGAINEWGVEQPRVLLLSTTAYYRVKVEGGLVQVVRVALDKLTRIEVTRGTMRITAMEPLKDAAAGRWLLLWPSRGSHRNRNNLLHCSLPLCVTSCAEPLSELPLLRLAKLLVLT